MKSVDLQSAVHSLKRIQRDRRQYAALQDRVVDKFFERMDAYAPADVSGRLRSSLQRKPWKGQQEWVDERDKDTIRVGSRVYYAIMVNDGHVIGKRKRKAKHRKQRKIERCKMLLRRAQVDFTLREYDVSGVTAITITSRSVPIWLRLFRDKTFGSWLFDENPDVFFDEISYWDGYNSAKNSVQYTSCNRQNADMVQAFAHLSGRAALLKVRERTEQAPAARAWWFTTISLLSATMQQTPPAASCSTLLTLSVFINTAMTMRSNRSSR